MELTSRACAKLVNTGYRSLEMHRLRRAPSLNILFSQFSDWEDTIQSGFSRTPHSITFAELAPERFTWLSH